MVVGKLPSKHSQHKINKQNNTKKAKKQLQQLMAKKEIIEKEKSKKTDQQCIYTYRHVYI